ncbi:hypothetical protein OJAV_G00016240 [Oryzias javanicus]|uniref:C2H2-type domain-containing protein n=1 Tax=Oryzias javanicus TaxID=123683 RepID=A0A437DKR2_ORYJA|nr:hypothetical protein OJAV_G00016240 [Oryzias javanicus]
MSSLQSLRELINERLAAAAEEIFRLCEGTMVQYEQELCRQRRLLDICWKPQIQLQQIVISQHHMSEEQNLYNQEKNLGVEQDQPEPPQIKEEEVDLSITQDEKHLDLKQETDTLMEIPTYEEHEKSEVDLNNQQNSNVMDRQGEEGNQHEESASTPDEETDPQNRDQRKKRDRRHVQSVASSHMSESQFLPQHHMSEEQNLFNQEKNLGVEQDQPEPPQIKEEQVELSITQDEEHLDLKQETDTLMEIPTYEEHEKSEVDLNNQQNFNVMDRQGEEGNQHEESTSTPDEETDPQNRDQRKERDRSHVQSVASSHMSESQCDSDVRKNVKNYTLVEQCQQPHKEKGLSHIESVKRTIIPHNLSVHTTAESDERLCFCKVCGIGFSVWYLLKAHMKTHPREKRFACKECDKSFNCYNHLETHMRIHTGEKPFTCKECNRSFTQICHLRRHMKIHTGEKPYFCKECDRRFKDTYNLKTHMKIHT